MGSRSKLCRGCQRELPAASFGRPSQKGYLRSRCLECRRAEYAANPEKESANRRASYRRHHEERRAKAKEYYERNAEAINAERRARRQSDPAWRAYKMALDRKYYNTEKPRIKQYTQAYRREQKAALLAAYGGRCRCCGEHRPRFLAVDHVNGDGAAQRSTGLVGEKFYRWLRDNGYPQDGYQLLCHNCNFAKGKDRTCPHVAERASLDDATREFPEDMWTA